ncbi:hypothetical protein BgiBS90_010284 [Biomphalaria glabrata]|nr:hypothetical protein BgiBS90_010284 [Biomphalaria glabrata]
MLTLVTHTLSMSRFDVPMAQLTRLQHRSSDGSTILTNKVNILNRWTEHYSILFGDKRHVSEESLANVPQKTMREDLDDPHLRKLRQQYLNSKNTRHLALMTSG